jgi:hypothetical protein
MATINKKKENATIGGNAEKLEPSWIVDWNVKWYSQCRK